MNGLPKLQNAEQGDAEEQLGLRLFYKIGNGVPQDYRKAVEWYTKAVEQGDAMSQYNLGLCYHNGQGVPRNYDKAIEWYTKAAEQGNDNARQAIASLLATR